MFSLIKRLLRRTVWREGAVRTILRGPSKGLRYRIFPAFGRAPIHGAWEPAVQALMVKHVRPDTVAYDIGANYGIHVLLIARLTSHGRGQVHAFEPMPKIMSQLRENVALNGLSNVVFVEEALSDTGGTMTFYLGDHVGAGHLGNVGRAEGQQIRVNTLTLDQYVFDRGNQPPNLMKIDVEGAESRVLRGGRRVLATSRPLLLMDLHGIDQEIAVGKILRELRYEIYRVDDGRRVPDVESGHDNPTGMADEILAVPID